VAVVSISRIQIRRGQRNAATGLPQLASGELGWAIDTQEIFIGNGAVSEGAPQVGNTKILTEHDNLFQFANTYSYRIDDEIIQTGSASISPIQRTLQQRLDDRVSVKAFGCKGDGTNCTIELQRAIDQLYINSATKGNPRSRVVLHMEAGEYLINDTIYIPPYVTLVGAGADKTRIIQTAPVAVFETVNQESVPGSPASDAVSTFLNQAREITIKGMTLDVVQAAGEYPVLKLQSCRNSKFEDIKIIGSYETPLPAIDDFGIGIQLNALSTAVTCKQNIFRNIIVQGIGYAVESKFDVIENKFENCVFETLGYGIVFGVNATSGLSGQLSGPSHNIIESCKFRSISKQGLWIEFGQYNLSSNNQYYDVGNEGGTSANALHSVIFFNDEYNQSDNDFFQRADDLAVSQQFSSVAFVPLIQGKTFSDYNFNIKTSIGEQPNFGNVLRLPGSQTGVYSIKYWYNSEQFNAMRSGTIDVTFDTATNDVFLTDDYDYVGASGFDSSLVFRALLSDENSDGDLDTLIIQARNPVINEQAELYMKITTKS